jgi:ABC-type branched-subunit amino acid transport system substrate-binding protein
MVESAVKRLKKFGYKKVGYEGTVVAWGTDVLAAVKEMCPKYGIDLVGHVLCEVEGKDFTIQASKLRKTGPDAIIVCDMPPGQSVWARSLAQIGWKPFVLSIDAGSTENAMNISSPKYFEGWQAKSEIDRTKPYLIEVFDRVAAFTGKRYENEMVARAWDVAQIMVEAIRLSGNPDDPEAIRDGIYKIKNFTIAMGKKETTGSFEMGRNHMLGSDDMTFYEIRSGKFIVVD